MKNNTIGGMTLIELVIAIAIGALLLLGLYRSFNTTQKSVQTVDGMLANTHQEIMLYDLLYKDISSMFITKKPEQKAEQPKKEKKQTPPCVYKQEKNMQSFSFATTHTLKQYNQSKPHCTRVTYTLKKEPYTQPQQFNLMRSEQPQESVSNKENKQKSYRVASGLTSLTADLFYPEQKDKKDAATQDDKKINYRTTSSWPLPKPKDKKRPEQPPLPAYINIKGSFYNAMRETQESFIYKIPIFGFAQPEKKKQEPAKPTPKKPAPKGRK